MVNMQWIRRAVPIGLVTSCIFGASVASAAAGPDFTQFGFPTVVAQTTVQSGAAATLVSGNLTVLIPAGAFPHPVKFELLEGPLSNFQMNAPAGQTPLVDFAFKVVDTTTNSILGKFLKPVVVSYTNSAISAQSQYWDISTAGAYLPNPLPPVITGNTLRHGNLGAPVGWVITSPSQSITNATQPVTGLPMQNLLIAGLGLIAAGILAFAVRKRLS